jgi:hypothetical protein
MAAYLLDSSALIKRYVQERGTRITWPSGLEQPRETAQRRSPIGSQRATSHSTIGVRHSAFALAVGQLEAVVKPHVAAKAGGGGRGTQLTSRGPVIKCPYDGNAGTNSVRTAQAHPPGATW